MNKIIAPSATKFAYVKIPKGTKCFDSEYGGSIMSDTCYYNFTENGKVTKEEYTVLVTNVSATDILFNYYAKTNEGYVKIDKQALSWYSSIEEAEKNITSQSKLWLWLTKPLFETTTTKDPNILTGVITNEIQKNILFITTETGWPGNYKKGYKLTRLSGIIITLTAIIIGFLIYKKKH